MEFIQAHELERMERLLAGLLDCARDAGERSEVLRLHQRLLNIHDAQRGLRTSLERLESLTGQISR